MPAAPATPLARAQRVLVTMAATVIGLTVLAIAAIAVCRAVGVPAASFRTGALAFVAVFPLPGIAIGLLLLIALIVVGGVARARAQRSPR